MEINLPDEVRQAEGIKASLKLLKNATTARGILASTFQTGNYRRIWARDGIVCGMAGLLENDEILIEGLKSTLTTLANHQGKEGQIPSNVQISINKESFAVSYGGLVGRVDPVLWFIIGVCNYVRFLNDETFKTAMEKPLLRCLSLLDAWEFNGRGLLYVPQGGDWADEFILSGYVLYDQLLRYWALRCYSAVYENSDAREKADHILVLIRSNYWMKSESTDRLAALHPVAYHNFMKDHENAFYWLAAFNPAGYSDLFDTLSNALGILLKVGTKKQTEQVISHGHSLTRQLAFGLLPSFWPPVQKGDPEWEKLRLSCINQFRNYPYQYQNGGVWPIINAWWGLALRQAGETDKAQKIFDGILRLTKLGEENNSDWGFYEYADAQNGQPGGVKNFSWSAAAILMMNAALNNRYLYFGI